MRTASWITIVGVVTISLLQQSAVAARHIQITTCPYTTSVAGAIYTVTQNIESRGGGPCLDITAPGITINVNGKSVSGGEGIYIELTAKRVQILGTGTIWGGIEDKGDSALIKGLVIQGNDGIALIISGASGTTVEHNTVYGADGIDIRASQKCKIDSNKVRADSGGEYDPAYDIFIEDAAAKGQSKGNIISNNNVASNGALDGASIGILVGDPPEENGDCPAGSFPIEGTVIVNNNASEHSGWGVPGIVISLGCENDSAHSVVKLNVAKKNLALYAPAYDAYDGNPNCGTNTWEDNHFKTTNQSCIK
jgi:Right handed beta helix region